MKDHVFGQEWYYPHTMFILEQKLMIASDWMCVYACPCFCGHSVRIHHPSSIIHGQNCHHWMMILPRCGVFAGSGKKISCIKKPPVLPPKNLEVSLLRRLKNPQNFRGKKNIRDSIQKKNYSQDPIFNPNHKDDDDSKVIPSIPKTWKASTSSLQQYQIHEALFNSVRFG